MVSGHPGETGSRHRGRIGLIALWVLQVALAVVFVVVGLPKALGDPVAVEPFDLIGVGVPGMVTLGWLELAGALALLVPRLCSVAAICQIPLMIGATTFSAVLDPDLIAVPATTLVGVCVVAWFRRRDLAALLGKLRGAVAPTDQ